MTTVSASNPCPLCGQMTLHGSCTRHGAVYGRDERHEQDRLFSPVRTLQGQTTMEELR
jgi:hypothetical protein